MGFFFSIAKLGEAQMASHLQTNSPAELWLVMSISGG